MNDLNFSADGKRSLVLNRYYFAKECEKAFRRLKRDAFIASFTRLFDRLGSHSPSLEGQSWRGRRATDARKSVLLPLELIEGYIEPDGPVTYGRKAFPARLLPRWIAILEKGGAETLPAPRAYRLGGGWFLESGLAAVFALEAARALGLPGLRVNVPLRFLEAVGGAVPAFGPRGKALEGKAELLAG